MTEVGWTPLLPPIADLGRQERSGAGLRRRETVDLSDFVAVAPVPGRLRARLAAVLRCCSDDNPR